MREKYEMRRAYESAKRAEFSANINPGFEAWSAAISSDILSSEQLTYSNLYRSECFNVLVSYKE